MGKGISSRGLPFAGPTLVFGGVTWLLGMMSLRDLRLKVMTEAAPKKHVSLSSRVLK